jgi:hypothetical protein
VPAAACVHALLCAALQNRWRKRGLAITPTKFGIAFTKLTYNQGGALVHVYTDGTVRCACVALRWRARMLSCGCCCFCAHPSPTTAAPAHLQPRTHVSTAARLAANTPANAHTHR